VRNMKFTSKTVVLTLIASLLVTVAAPSRAYAGFGDYTDIAGHWAAAALETLYDLGALDDDPPPLFRPGDPVSRGKFAKYLVLGWNIQPYAGAEQFLSDVPPGNPFYVYANALYLRGLMVGSGGAFGVGASLTREQCATVLVRAAGLEPTAVMRPSAEAQAIVASAWTDAADISPWAIPYMAEAFVQELFKGDDAGTVRPLDPMSKAEAATVVSRIKNLKPLEDFGDAPDWPSYFGFPSLLTNDGARHQDYKQVWLGERADGEIDSRQINSDFFDDGFVRFIPTGRTVYTKDGTLAEWTLEFEVSVASRDPALYGDGAGAQGNLLYFNLLIDHDMDMNWADVDEWVITNLPIDPNTWSPGETTTTLQEAFHIPVGVDPYECWFRMTLTWGEMAPPGWSGTGRFIFGETEDYGPEEQKVVVLDDLELLVDEWSRSQDPDKEELAAYLSLIIPFVEDLIAEEQADDPVQVLIEKKKNILEMLYEAAERAIAAGMDPADVERIWTGLWKRMAFVAEEEVKKCNFFLLREMLRLNFNIPGDCTQQVRDILGKLADLIYEQEIGDPPEVLLQKKNQIIALLQALIQALENEGLKSAAQDARVALAWMLWLKAIEQPNPPGGPGQPPPGKPPWHPPDDGEEPPDDGQPPEEPGSLDTAPKLPGVITGVSSIFEVIEGVVVMKIHITNHGPEDVYDIEIYPAHQQDWPEDVGIDPSSGPEGWTAQTGKAGVGWYGDTPLIPCQPYYFTFSLGDLDPSSIIFVLTDENHEPIGSSTSQPACLGMVTLTADGSGSNLLEDLCGEEPGAASGGETGSGDLYVDSFFDVFYSIEVDPTHQGGETGTLQASETGGILYLEEGLAGLDPGGYVPEPVFSPGEWGYTAPVVPEGYYALADHTGEGFALLHVVDVMAGGVVLEVCYNPGGRFVMALPTAPEPYNP